MHIIGIEIKEGCSPEVIKNLQPGWYPFGDYEIPKKSNKYVWRKGSELSDRLYQLHPDMPQISVSCIIGMNGSGKTTLIELAYRILNNYSVVAQGKSSALYEVVKTKGLNATLYFEVDKEVGYISCKDEKVELYYMTNGEGDIIPIEEHKLSVIKHNLFYTLGMNYSIYSMPFKDCYDDWLNCIFMNEDNYQTPLTLLPYRERGEISINSEMDLLNRRLVSLFILLYSQKKNLVNGYIPKEMEFTYNSKKWYELKERYETIFIKNGFGDCYDSAINKIKEEWKKQFCNYSFNKKIKEEIYDLLAYMSFYTAMRHKSFGEIFNIESIKEHDGQNIDDNGKYDEFVKSLMELRDVSSITLDIAQIRNYISQSEVEESILVDDFITVNNGNNSFRTYNEVYKLLPPHLYDIELYLEKKGDDKHHIPLSQLSSGEKQLLFTNSALLCHIYNLANARGISDGVPYKHINIMLDEVELYSHPEFQRNYIASFIDMLAGLHIDNTVIRSINIIIATHSPFIVSDVPQENILYLKESLRHENSMGTYCANIYDLLKNTFFMEYPMGECARRIIDKVIDTYNKNDEKAKQEIIDNKYFYYYLESIIAEPYLKSCIKTILRSIIVKNDGDLYELLSKKAELENQIRVVKEEIAKINEKN